MVTRVAVFVGTRADLGPLLPVLEAFEASDAVDLHLVVGVAFDRDDLADRLRASMSAPPEVARIHALAPALDSVDQATMLQHGPELSRGMARLCDRLAPEALVVLGDRWELLYVVPPTFLAGVRVVHLHGGEVTEGALDERVRHAVTKLADQHCVASPDSARRLLQLGETPDRVHVTGAPGLDRYRDVEPWSDEEFEQHFHQPLQRPLALFTYHPPTAESVASAGTWAEEALLATLDHCGTVIATHPGMDPGRDEVLSSLLRHADDPRLIVVESLGPRYPRTLATADVVVGNSSSGVIEAASVGVPAIDIGERQAGRLRGANVLHADEGRDGVAAQLPLALSTPFSVSSRTAQNPYGDGDAALRILDVVLATPGVRRTKPFNDSRTP